MHLRRLTLALTAAILIGSAAHAGTCPSDPTQCGTASFNTLTVGTSVTLGGVSLLQPSSPLAGTIFQLPANNGTSGYVLQTDGAGHTSWQGLPSGTAARAANQSAPALFRDNIEVWQTSNETVTTSSSGAFALSGGKGFIQPVTVPGDASVIWVVFSNDTGSSWTLSEAAVATSAQWGCDGAATPGVSACDDDGNVYPAFVPLTFKNSGTLTAPWPPTYFSTTTNFGNSCNGAIIPLVVGTGGAAAGQKSIPVTAATASNLMGQCGAQSGMYVADGYLTSGIPANTTFTLSGTTLTASNNLQNSGLAAGQTIWVTATALGSQDITIPAVSLTAVPSLIYSDPIELQTVPRSDGPILAGESVLGTCGGTIPTGQTVTGVTQISVTFSGTGLTGTCASGTGIAFGTTTTTTAPGQVGSDVLQVASTQYLSPGMAVSGTNVPSGAFVTAVCSAQFPCANSNYGSSYVRISATPTTQVATGTTLTFSVTAKTVAATSSGNTLPFMDTSADRIVTIRGFATGAVSSPGGSTMGGLTNGKWGAYQAEVGLSQYAAYQGNTSTDIVNFPANATNGSGNVGVVGQTPVYMVIALTRSRGLVMLNTGTSHPAGDTTISGDANYLRLGAYRMSRPTRPVTAITAAAGGQNPNVWLQDASNILTAFHNAGLNIGLASVEDSEENGGDVNQTYAAEVDALQSYVLSYGGQFVHQTDWPRAAATIGNLPLAGGAYSGTTPTFLVSLKAISTGGSAYTAAITALAPNQACVPSGTTASVPGSGAVFTLTLSQSINCPAGTVLTTGVIPATVTSGSTGVTLAEGAPLSGTVNVAGTADIGSGCTLTITKGSTSATLSSSVCATGSGSPTLTLSTGPGASTTMPGNANILAAAGQQGTGTLVFDTFPLLEDPSNRGFYLAPYTTDGIHANDYGHSVLANDFIQMLENSGAAGQIEP